MEEHLKDPSSYGIYLVDRRYKGIDESIQELSDVSSIFQSLHKMNDYLIAQ